MGELIVRRAGGVGTVVFSNVAKHNAVTLDMWRAFPEVMGELGADPSIRVVVVQGDGGRAFISGADISQFEQARADEAAQARYNQAVDEAYEAPVECPKPVIAKIRGYCFGGGLGLAAACDVRVCSDDAAFRMPAARLGLGYHPQGLRRFMSLIGPANTADIFFSARPFGAPEALRMGFVSRVIPAGELDAEVDAWTAMVAENAPLTIAAAKRTLRDALRDPGDRDPGAIERLVAACFASEDYREGRRAFAEKRKPDFRGR